MINLFEYQNKVSNSDSLSGLEDFLDDIWSRREKFSYFKQDKSDNSDSQKFINFLRKTNEIKSNKYVGVIYFQGERINLLPKIFYDPNKKYSENDICQIQNHFLWYISHCRKIKFPSYLTRQGALSGNFLEILIFSFSKYARNLINSLIYQQYTEFAGESSFLRGKVNFSDYAKENMSKGKYHKVNCSFDIYDIDNEFNRIIKYVSNLLFSITENADSKKYLREILFLFEEVSDVKATAEQCDKFRFNPIFGDYEVVRDYCKLFLEYCISYDYKNSLKLFAFLLPMDYVYEDFIYGFIQKEIDSVSVKPQKVDTYLDEEGAFNLKPDIYITLGNRFLIADTKYKIVYSNDLDPKNGISQSDIYQMLAYAVRFKVDKIILFYPNSVLNQQMEESKIVIKDALANNTEITIFAYQLPIIDFKLLESSLDQTFSISDLFASLKTILIGRLNNIFSTISIN